MKNTLLAILFSAGLLATGCSTVQKSDTAALDGVWKGYDKAQPEGICSIKFSQNTVEFQGADKDDWCRGIFALHEAANPKQIVATILEAPDPRAIGQTVHAIYRIEGPTLTVAGRPPGSPEMPASFDAPGTRVLVLKKP